MSIDLYFPNLRLSPYRITSGETADYNCIAWAAGNTDIWWWPDRMNQYYWPEAVKREASLPAFIEAFGLLGYAECKVPDLESGFEKVALYANQGNPTHAARQLPTGKWTSKLGNLEDIEHTLDALNGTHYGSVAVILKRPSPSQQ